MVPTPGDTHHTATRRSGHEARNELLGDLAELVQELARQVQNLDLGHVDGLVELAPVERMLMHQIDVRPGITPGEAAAALRLRTSNVAAALRTLQAHGFVTRTPDTTDKRVIHLFATAAAHRNLGKVREAWAAALDPSLGPDVDLPGLVAGLGRLRTRLNDKDGTTPCA